MQLALAVAEPIAKFAKKQLEKEKEDEYVVVRNVGEQKRMMA
jgi:DNA (cytosine-5)-methyltransferase 1